MSIKKRKASEKQEDQDAARITPVLKPVEEIIVAAYLQNGRNQSEAYLAGHPNSKASTQSLHVQASRFFAQVKVQLRIDALQSLVEAKAVDAGQLLLTQEQHMAKLEQLRDAAEARGQLSAAIAAEVKRGELRRFYIKQVETGKAGDFERMSDEELHRFVAEEAKELGVVAKPNGTRH